MDERLRALEAELSRRRKTSDPGEPRELAEHYWQAAEAAAGHRDRLKALKRAWFLAEMGFEAGESDPVVLESYAQIALAAAPFGFTPSVYRGLAARALGRAMELGERPHLPPPSWPRPAGAPSLDSTRRPAQ